MFLKISQNSQENSSARVSFLIKLQATTKSSNILKQFVGLKLLKCLILFTFPIMVLIQGCCRRIAWVCLTILWGPATLLKKRYWHRCFSVNFAKCLRTPFLTEHLQWLLLPIAFYGDLNEIIGTGASSSLLRLLNRDLKLLRCLGFFFYFRC